MPLADYTFQLGPGPVLNSDAVVPFVDITKVAGLDSAPYRETIRDHEGTDGGYIDAEFEQGREIILEGTAYCDINLAEQFFDDLKENFAPVVAPAAFVFKAPGVEERVVFVKPRGVRYDWESARRTGVTPIQFLMYAEDPRLYDNSLLQVVIPFGGLATTGYGFTNVIDTFTNRTDSNGWGTAETGESWSVAGAAASKFSTSGGKGRHLQDGGTGVREESIVSAGVPSVEFAADVTLAIVPTGGAITPRVAARYTDTSNFYQALVSIAAGTGVATLQLFRNVAGVGASISSSVGIGTHVAGNTWRILIGVVGTQIRAKAWRPGVDTLPVDWQLDASDTSLSTGNSVACLDRLETGNTDAPTIEWDNVQAYKGFAFNLSFGATVPPAGAFIVNSGNRPTPAILRITGPVVDPRIVNDTDSKTLAFLITLGNGETLDVDLANHTVVLNGTANRRGTLQSPDWFLFRPGNTFIRFGGASGTGTLTVIYRYAWR